ncbi:MAG: serine/threonine protein kinase, partial [Pirellula sp.]|nr:serine/threonine protein kinase [Pirellula sp.]
MASSEQLDASPSSEEISEELSSGRGNPDEQRNADEQRIAAQFEERVKRVWVGPDAVENGPRESVKNLGRYQIECFIGRGGFGIVYLANDPVLHRKVALKIPLLGDLEESRQKERFLSEARAAASLQHRYVMPIYDAGEIDGIGYIAMRYCPLGTLATWLATQKSPIPPRTAVALMHAICEGVGDAHERNIIHRDLKPANILLDDAPANSSLRDFELSIIPLVSDFGMAKLAGWDDPEMQRTQLTRTGTRIGTPCYMPPEHATGRAKESQKSADVYGLGAILFELLTGRPPFTGESDYEVLHQVVTSEPASIRKYRPEVPITLERICRKCLEKSPDRRYCDANELGKDLARFLAGERITNLPRIKGSFVRATFMPAVLCIIILMLFVAAWLTPPLMIDTSLFAWRRERPTPVMNAPLGGYATAIENALPTATGVIDDDARRLL